ncbi:RDD family protein [Kitasatospora kifunensis]|uniref:Putative RDD family membrane protein YckC n=1 Tax=Kitasatospora kifunensis TaxID=58351 RepID=A0A7W7VX96_KITKI|nr:RDD family protein [Kitasatospora kifunensis]MBB4925484.1 putative RDD family membrane protein YckC [Kitasatospora kifunensis]
MSDQPLVASADTAAVPAPGYYPDPSVPGFVRYWNGGTWVPGTSRPAPADGEVLPAPAFAARPAVRPNARYIPPPARLERVGERLPEQAGETGPVFLDETAAGALFTRASAEPEPEPAREPEPEPGSAGAGNWERSGWLADPRAQRGLLETGRAPRWVSWGAGEEPTPAPAADSAPAPAPDLAPAPTSASVPVPRGGAAVAAAAPVPAPVPAAAPVTVPVPVAAAPVVPVAPTVPLAPVPRRRSAQSTSGAAVLPARVSRQPVPVSKPGPVRAPAPVTGGVGRRLAARLVDGVVLSGVGAAVGIPLTIATMADVQLKLDRARTASHLTGREVQVWLIDGAFLGRVALLLGTLLLAGFLLEVLPTARTGRTFGKRLVGLRVVRAESGQQAQGGRGERAVPRPPSLGRAFVRWLVGQLSILTVLGPLVMLADRQQRRGWADRAARTRVVKA